MEERILRKANRDAPGVSQTLKAEAGKCGDREINIGMGRWMNEYLGRQTETHLG